MKQSFFKVFRHLASFYHTMPVRACIITALLINFIIEIFARHSFMEAVVHLCTNPLIFLYNSTIIFLTLSVSFLFKRRNFVVALMTILWASLGLVNFILLFFRTTPLSLIDFLIIKNAIGMLPVYLSIFELILVVLWICAAIALIVLAWRKLPKNKVIFKKSVPLLVGTFITVSLSSSALTTAAANSNGFSVITKAYDEWGFVCCFSRGLIDSGIDKPSGYSKLAIDTAVNTVKQPQKSEEVQPNVIVMQLESFFDISYMKGITYSEDPIPTFTELKNSGPSGFLTMPSIGGGTANSEFEVLTGIDLGFFGIGEYPYQTVLKETPCESMASIFKRKGYSTAALHNHTAIFYKRNQVYSSLGFDYFVPVEFMDVKERNELGWAKDEALIGEITEALTQSPERDFVFTVTMQGHGKYPKKEKNYEKIITLDGFDTTDELQTELKCGLEFYVNQLRQTDNVIKTLVEYFKNYPEPVALILYGDHLPAFEITNDDLNGINMYQTEYCIWTNYKQLEATREDMYAYQLASTIFDKLDLNGNIFTDTTATLKNDASYLDTLSLLAYDMLYGKQYAFDTELVRSDMKFGLKPITVSGLEVREETALILGDRFSKYSHVEVDGNTVDTTFVDRNTLKINLDDLNPEGSIVGVVQLNKHSKKFAESNTVISEPFETAPVETEEPISE